jgi:hypothetical protein
VVALGLAVFTASVRADVVELFPIKDATLVSRAPDNSLGGATWFTAGVTQNGDTNYGLMQFDIAGSIPTNSRIVGAELRIVVTKVPKDGLNDSTFSLRRMFRQWGEGFNAPPAIGGSPGLGLPAMPGDATWTHSLHGSTNTWGVPGGQEGVDFSANISGSTTISGYDSHYYSFESSSGTVADVQDWLDHPENNFGWLLKTESEPDIRFTARGFGSREMEDTTVSPQLIVDYAPPPTIATALVSNQIEMTFLMAPGGTYRVEARSSLNATNSWSTLTNFGFQFFYQTVTVRDSLASPQRIYRLRVD